MPIRYYDTSDRRVVTIKPWALDHVKQMAKEDCVPIVKVVTDAVVYAYNQRQSRASKRFG